MGKLIGIASEVIHFPAIADISSPCVEFLLDGRKVHIDVTIRASIDNGDRIALVGTRRYGVLHGLAYRNLTRNTDGDAGLCVLSMGAAILILFGVTSVLTSFSEGWELLAFGIGSIAMGAFLVTRCNRIDAAQKLLEDEA